MALSSDSRSTDIPSVRAKEIDERSNRLLSTFLAYRYNIDIKPETLYSAHDRASLKQQISWELRDFPKALSANGSAVGEETALSEERQNIAAKSVPKGDA